MTLFSHHPIHQPHITSHHHFHHHSSRNHKPHHHCRLKLFDKELLLWILNFSGLSAARVSFSPPTSPSPSPWSIEHQREFWVGRFYCHHVLSAVPSLFGCWGLTFRPLETLGGLALSSPLCRILLLIVIIIIINIHGNTSKLPLVIFPPGVIFQILIKLWDLANTTLRIWVVKGVHPPSPMPNPDQTKFLLKTR